jgi:hypothetical protein
MFDLVHKVPPFVFLPNVVNVDQVSAGGEQAAVAVLLGHGRGGELDQGDGEHLAPGQYYPFPSSNTGETLYLVLTYLDTWAR